MAKVAYRHWLGTFEHSEDDGFEGVVDDDPTHRRSLTSLSTCSEMLLHICLELRGDPIDVGTVRKVARVLDPYFAAFSYPFCRLFGRLSRLCARGCNLACSRAQMRSKPR